MLKKGQYVLYCMFPEKGQKPKEVVRIAGVSEPECGKARYGIEYAKWDMKNLQICVGGGASYSWAEDCFAEITDPIQKLIVKKQENIDHIKDFDRQAARLMGENNAINTALRLLIPENAEQEAEDGKADLLKG